MGADDRDVLHFLTDPHDQRIDAAVLRRALVPVGRVVIAGFAGDGPEGCAGLPVGRYGPEVLARLLGEDFAVLDARREIHITPGGSWQSFTWIVAGRDRAHEQRGPTALAPSLRGEGRRPRCSCSSSDQQAPAAVR